MKTAVVTVVHGRTAHLRKQLEGLGLSTVQPDHHVLVAIDDGDVARTVPSGDGRIDVVPLLSTGRRLPVAAARNLGARKAIDAGADLLIFLDVDCIPAPELVGAYLGAAARPDHRGALLCGPVTYLEAPGPGGYELAELPARRNPHPARPAPRAGDVVISTDYDLFWSLSFAVTAPVWLRIGGFCTDYAGYGGEDTDFARIAAAEGISMRWVGGAHAYHQHHPVSDPPVEHLHDIVDNAEVFHRRWGWWPMQGWLEAFEERGLIAVDVDGRPRVR